MAFTPVAGKVGIVTINGTSALLNAFRLASNADMLDVSHFSMTPDADGNYAREFIAGLVGTSVDVEGDWDNQAVGSFLTGATIKLRAGMTGTGAVGFTSTCSFSFSMLVEGIRPGCEVAGKGQFGATIRVTGILTYPSNT